MSPDLLENASRNLSLLADDLRLEGAPTQASVCQSAAEELARLAFTVAELDMQDVASRTAAVVRAMRQVTEQLGQTGEFEGLRERAQALCDDLRAIHRSTLTDTQPIDLKG